MVLLAVGARLVAMTYWSAESTTDPDAYVGLARGLAEGRGYVVPGTTMPTAYRPPGYPLWLTIGHLVPGVSITLWIPLSNLLFDLGTLAAVGVWCQLARLERTVRLIALLGVAVDPLMVRYVPLPMTESLFTCLTTWGLCGLTWWTMASPPASQSPPRIAWRDGGLVGLVWGLAAFCRPSVGVFLAGTILGLVGLAWRAGESTTRRARWSGLVYWGVGLGLILGPWGLRNQLVMGHPIVTTTHGGYTLLLGNNPVFYDEVARQPWGTVWSGASLERWQRTMLGRMDADLGPAADEVAKDRWQRRGAQEAIAADPSGFAAAVVYRVRSFWSLSPRGPVHEQVAWLRRGVMAWYGGLFTFAAFGAYHAWRRGFPGVGWGLWFVVALQGVHLVYWTDTRMRLPLTPLLAIAAALGYGRLCGVITARPSSQPASVTKACE